MHSPGSWRTIAARPLLGQIAQQILPLRLNHYRSLHVVSWGLAATTWPIAGEAVGGNLKID
jgi:hypothetical protein